MWASNCWNLIPCRNKPANRVDCGTVTEKLIGFYSTKCRPTCSQNLDSSLCSSARAWIKGEPPHMCWGM